MSITTIDDNKLIHFEVYGRGQPILFLHDMVGSWRYWWPAMQNLASRNRSYALDFWGFGDSTKSPNLYTIDAYVELIHHFVSKLEMSKPFSIVGHGMGAIVSLSLATKYPDHAEKLFLISAPILGSMLDERLSSQTLDSYVNKVIGKSNSFPEIDAEINKTDEKAVADLYHEISNNDYTNLLSNCPCPALLLSGGQDPIVAPYVNSPQSQADNRLLIEIDSCAHFPMLEEKAKFNRLLQDFLLAKDSLNEISLKDFWYRRVR